MFGLRRYILVGVMFFLQISMSYAQIEPDGRPWDKSQLDSILNTNLVLNGGFDIAFPADFNVRRLTEKKYAGKVVEPVAPCWWVDDIASVTASGKGLILENDNKVRHLLVRTYDYKFSGAEHPYDIMIEGRFAQGADVRFSVEICGETCEVVPFPVHQIDHQRFSGKMDVGRFGHKISHNLIVGVGHGAKEIHQVRVSNQSSPMPGIVNLRDEMSAGICFPLYEHVQGDFRAWEVSVLIGLSLALLTLVLWCFMRSLYFYGIILFALLMGGVLGLIPLYMGWSVPRIEQGVVDRQVMMRIAYYISLALSVCIVTAYWVHKNVDVICAKTKIRQLDIRLPTWSVLVCFIILTLIYVLTVFSFNVDRGGGIGLMGFANESLKSMNRALLIQHTLGLKTHHFRLLFYYLPIFLGFYLINAFIDRMDIKGVVLVVAVCAFLLIIGGEKAPLIWYCAAVGYIFLVRVDLKKTACCIAVSAVLLSLIMLVYGPGGIQLVVDRALLGGFSPTYHALIAFPDVHPYLNGTSIGFWGMKVVTGEYFDLDLYLWRNVFESSYFSHLSGTATGALWVQGYANYGILGVAIFSAIAAIVLVLYDRLMRQIFVPHIAIPLCAVLVFFFCSLAESNLTSLVFNYYLYVFVFWVLLSAIFIRLLHLLPEKKDKIE